MYYDSERFILPSSIYDAIWAWPIIIIKEDSYPYQVEEVPLPELSRPQVAHKSISSWNTQSSEPQSPPTYLAPRIVCEHHNLTSPCDTC